MIRVLHIISGLSRGGAEAMLLKLLASSDRRNFRNVVISLTDDGVYGEAIRAMGMELHSLGMNPATPSPLAYLRLRRVVDDVDPAVIQGWMYHGGLAALLVGRRCPVVVAIRGALYEMDHLKPATRIVVRLLRRLSTRADAITFNSKLSRDQHAALGFARDRMLVIPNGFDTDYLTPDEERRRTVRRQLGIDREHVVFLHAARLHPMKDHAGLLAAISEFANPAARFLLSGPGVDADASIFSGLRDDRVRMLGDRDDIPDLLQAADCLVSSSWSEAFPNVLGEAMACGVPCVTTDAGDSACIVGDTGFVVPPRDPAALASAMEVIAAMPASERRALGARARQRVVERFSLAGVSARYDKLYQILIDERGHSGALPPVQ